MDELDRRILNVLQENSRLSFRKIAEAIGSTAATVSSRVKTMEEKGIIKKYTVLLDYDVLDMVTLLVTVHANLSHIDEITEAICGMREVCCVLRVTGSSDLAVLVRCENRKTASMLLDKLYTVPGITSVNSQIVLDTLQEGLCVTL
ncbi:MAG: Lrp/AsnC family transcriptional regulator [Candidatus Methanofastidiosia archaeon]|jgi:Lrp/AsnC family transcriptional regulator for asnA, asnC and gidA